MPSALCVAGTAVVLEFVLVTGPATRSVAKVRSHAERGNEVWFRYFTAAFFFRRNWLDARLNR